MAVLTVVEVAAMFRVDVRTIRRMIKNGKIKAVKLGRGYRIDEREIKKLVSEKV
jgi:excisionase family DNA binding protein